MKRLAKLLVYVLSAGFSRRTAVPDDSETTDRTRAKRIIECVHIFSKGCTVAGPYVYAAGIGPVDPGECPECCEAFLKEVAKAMDGWEPRPDEGEAPR